MRTPEIIEAKLGREKALGLMVPGVPCIVVDPRQTQRSRLATMIHEAVHHAAPDMSEKDVARMARLVRNVLWQDGWRTDQ